MPGVHHFMKLGVRKHDEIVVWNHVALVGLSYSVLGLGDMEPYVKLTAYSSFAPNSLPIPNEP